MFKTNIVLNGPDIYIKTHLIVFPLVSGTQFVILNFHQSKKIFVVDLYEKQDRSTVNEKGFSIFNNTRFCNRFSCLPISDNS